MFTWICPQCGKEVPPHENDCPFCREQAAGGAQVPSDDPIAPVQSPPPVAPSQPPQAGVEQAHATRQPAAPQQQLPTARHPSQYPQPQAPPRQQVYEIGQKQGLPGWFVTLLVAIGLTAAGAAFYYWIYPALKGGVSATPRNAIAFEEVPEAHPVPVARGRVARMIEVTGFRITEDANKRTQIQFLLVNHSAADIGDLAGKVKLRKLQTGGGDDHVAEFEFHTSRLAPYASIEFKTVVNTDLRAYEMPDWQFLTADVEITSPAEL